MTNSYLKQPVPEINVSKILLYFQPSHSGRLLKKFPDARGYPSLPPQSAPGVAQCSRAMFKLYGFILRMDHISVAGPRVLDMGRVRA